MKFKRSRRLSLGVVLFAELFLLTITAVAQEATLTGTVTDSTGGVLPGVTITAVHQATGNTFVAVTDDRGAFRLPVRTGAHRVTAELAGFGTVARTMDLLINQQGVMNLQLAPSTLAETITVTGEAPLIQTSTSQVGGNIDPNQMQNLPINGRNWLDLAILAPGSRQNASSDTLGSGDYQYQINVDGQQVSDLFAGSFGQPRYSRESMAEVQLVTNRFDATQGRSSGQQMNAITKSGTNTPQGTFSGYFRDAKFNAKDFIANRVLPYSNQQLAWTYGGPIRKDKAHVFGSYEYEREPTTFTYQTPYAAWNIDQPSTRTEKKGLVRVDYQASPRMRLSFRLNKSFTFLPVDDRFSGGANRTPNSVIHSGRPSLNVQGTVTQVLSNSVVNEARIGYAGVGFYQHPGVDWQQHPADIGRQFGGSPILNMTGGLIIGQGHANSPVDLYQKPYSVRDDLTFSFNARGRHDVKSGGEFIYNTQTTSFCDFCMPTYDMQGGPVPANITQIIPDLYNPNTWNLAALSPITRNFQMSVEHFKVFPKRREGAAWMQDDWAATKRLTLNLGVRYDIASGNMQKILYPPFITRFTPTDKNNIAPRLGFAYSLNDKTVVRGGYGKYFAAQNENTVFWSLMSASVFKFQIFNDGRPDFAGNPFNGPVPTYAQALDMWSRGLVTRSGRNLFDPSLQTQWSHQASLGVQRQIGSAMSVTADWVYVSNHDLEIATDVNLAFNLATGGPYPASDITKRLYQNFTSVVEDLTAGKDRYHGVDFAWQKRMSNRWQAAATYSLSYQYNWQHLEPPPGCAYLPTISASGQTQCNVPIALHPSLADEWYRAGDQVKRATFNGIWQAPGGVQVSGLYFYGDNGKATPQAGVDPLGIQSSITGQGTAGRVRANGTLIERNSFDRPTTHRVDLRLQRELKLAGRSSITGILEVFNAFNHQNFNSFVLNERSPAFGQPLVDKNIAFQPRVMQLGFRLSF
jgi:carboxypeptidase family protein/TonB-dependent receptor-like protein